jgi:hypothetical protein
MRRSDHEIKLSWSVEKPSFRQRNLFSNRAWNGTDSDLELLQRKGTFHVADTAVIEVVFIGFRVLFKVSKALVRRLLPRCMRRASRLNKCAKLLV